MQLYVTIRHSPLFSSAADTLGAQDFYEAVTKDCRVVLSTLADNPDIHVVFSHYDDDTLEPPVILTMCVFARPYGIPLDGADLTRWGRVLHTLLRNISHRQHINLAHNKLGVVIRGPNGETSLSYTGEEQAANAVTSS